MGYPARRLQSASVAGAFADRAVARRLDFDGSAPPAPEDVDVLTAMALSRATIRALMSLSALSHREMVLALEHEIAAHETQDDVCARLVAEVLKLHLKSHR